MNIQAALKKLSELGLTDEQIGIEIGARQSIITRLRTGKHKSTSYERGTKIISLLENRLASETATPR